MSDISLTRAIIDLVNTNKPFTDIHIEQDAEMMWRRPTGWEPTGFGVVSSDQFKPLLSALDKDYENILKTRGAFDRPVTLNNSRLRCNVFKVKGGNGISVSVRKHPLTPIDFKLLGLPNEVEKIFSWGKGLLIVSGATGSGKTTTLASMLDQFNQRRSSHIVTIEQPIEYVIERKKSIISQKEVPIDTPSFSEGLRDALRQKPDIIMIGEVRDRDTADTIMHAAESGHMVLATMHTNSAEGTITKLLSFFPADEHASRATVLANSLIGVISQSLVPKANSDDFLMVSELLMNFRPQTAHIIKDIAKHSQLRDIMKKGEDNVSRHMNTVLLELVKSRQISREAAIKASHSPIDLLEAVSKIS